MAPLNTALQTGNRIEIITSPDAFPAPNWLKFARSMKARAHIRRWFREQEDAALGYPQEVHLLVEAVDRDSLLSDLASSISGLGISIMEVNLSTDSDRAIDRFKLLARSAEAQRQLLPRVKEIDGIIEADIEVPEKK